MTRRALGTLSPTIAARAPGACPGSVPAPDGSADPLLHVNRRIDRQ